MADYDFIVIGAGIAGASVAAHLAVNAQVLLLEMEAHPGYHTTGRSAAAYEPNYGPAAFRALTRAGYEFYKNTPRDFCDHDIFTPRGSLVIQAPGQEQPEHSYLSGDTKLREVSFDEMQALIPVLRRDYFVRGFYDDFTGDLDVDALHRGYLKSFKQSGGKLLCDAPVQALIKTGAHWETVTPHGTYKAKTIINAAGAWGDVVAKLGQVSPIGLTPRRRSIGVLPVEAQPNLMSWPFMVDVEETWYSKPQSGKLLVSSADVTPVEPHDAYGDDEAIAIGIDRLMQATTLEVNRLEHSWGGLRTFAPDNGPVCGFDPVYPGFFWQVGQGGYGIQSSFALSRLACTMAMREALPGDIMEQGLVLNDVTPDRFKRT